MSVSVEPLQCPICAFFDTDYTFLALHMEEVHFSEDSPFVARDAEGVPKQTGRKRKLLPGHDADGTSSTPSKSDFVVCLEEDCGEDVLLSEMQEHMDYHLAQRLNDDVAESRQPSKMSVSPEDIQDALSRRSTKTSFNEAPQSRHKTPREALSLGPGGKEHRTGQRDLKTQAVRRLGVSTLCLAPCR